MTWMSGGKDGWVQIFIREVWAGGNENSLAANDIDLISFHIGAKVGEVTNTLGDFVASGHVPDHPLQLLPHNHPKLADCCSIIAFGTASVSPGLLVVPLLSRSGASGASWLNKTHEVCDVHGGRFTNNLDGDGFEEGSAYGEFLTPDILTELNNAFFS